jgi:hypothetical protein
MRFLPHVLVNPAHGSNSHVESRGDLAPTPAGSTQLDYHGTVETPPAATGNLKMDCLFIDSRLFPPGRTERFLMISSLRVRAIDSANVEIPPVVTFVFRVGRGVKREDHNFAAKTIPGWATPTGTKGLAEVGTKRSPTDC